jgi:hypothetical protein
MQDARGALFAEPSSFFRMGRQFAAERDQWRNNGDLPRKAAWRKLDFQLRFAVAELSLGHV